MKSRRVVLVVLIVAATFAAGAHITSAAAECGPSRYNLFHPTTGERVASARIDTGSIGADSGGCVDGVIGYTGVIVNVNPFGPGVASVGQSCFLGVDVGDSCLYNYYGGVHVSGSPDTTPVTTSTSGGPACVGSTCPSVAVNTGYSVHADSGNFSDAVVELPTTDVNEQACVRWGSGATC